MAKVTTLPSFVRGVETSLPKNQSVAWGAVAIEHEERIYNSVSGAVASTNDYQTCVQQNVITACEVRLRKALWCAGL